MIQMQTRNTVQRQIVLQTVQTMRNHPTADAVYEAIRAVHPSISKATVYRNLHQLADQGKIRQISVPNGADHFDFNMKNHYHVCCVYCGAVQDVYMRPIENLLRLVEDSSGAIIQKYNILFEGICSDCQKA